jgi:hypothetical protein
MPQQVGEIDSIYALKWIESVRRNRQRRDVYDLHAHIQVPFVPTEMKIQDMIYVQRARRPVLNKADVESKVRPS